DLAFAADAGSEAATGSMTGYVLTGGLLMIAAFVIIFRRSIINHPTFSKIREFYSGLKEGFRAVFRMKRQTSFWLNTVFIWTSYFMMTYLCFEALPQTAHFTVADGFFIMVAASL